MRRSFIEAQSGKEDYAEQQSRKRKFRSRRQRVMWLSYRALCVSYSHVIMQVYEKRKGAVKEREEIERWETLSHLYMTEESDD